MDSRSSAWISSPTSTRAPTTSCRARTLAPISRPARASAARWNRRLRADGPLPRRPLTLARPRSSSVDLADVAALNVVAIVVDPDHRRVDDVDAVVARRIDVVLAIIGRAGFEAVEFE